VLSDNPVDEPSHETEEKQLEFNWRTYHGPVPPELIALLKTRPSITLSGDDLAVLMTSLNTLFGAVASFENSTRTIGPYKGQGPQINEIGRTLWVDGALALRQLVEKLHERR
jgi:hypothetical protein